MRGSLNRNLPLGGTSPALPELKSACSFGLDGHCRFSAYTPTASNFFKVSNKTGPRSTTRSTASEVAAHCGGPHATSTSSRTFSGISEFFGERRDQLIRHVRNG